MRNLVGSISAWSACRSYTLSLLNSLFTLIPAPSTAAVQTVVPAQCDIPDIVST